jgi:hypothetical protein
MSPVISTNRHVEIVCAASARVNVRIFYQPLTAPAGLGLLGVASRRGFSRSGSARLGRSQKDGLPTCREGYAFRLKAINSRTREGQPGRCPFLIGRGNGRQDARPCFARLPVAVLRNLRLGGGSSCFWLGLFRARCSRDSRRSFEAPALTWTKTISRSSAPQRAARPASGATTTSTCSPTALSLAASSTPMPGQLARRGCGRWPSGTTRIECRRTATSRRARPPWRRSRKAGGGNKGNGQKAPYLRTPRLRRQGIMSDEIERLNDPRPAD